MEGLYIIGGSPCSGKSTIAEMIAEKYDFNYFKVDDYLEQYMKKAQEDGKPLSARAMQMSPEETWMRSPPVTDGGGAGNLQRDFYIYMGSFKHFSGEKENHNGRSGIFCRS